MLSELKKGQVRVYDSLYSGSITKSLETQLKTLYQDGDKPLTISVPRTLQQQGCNDCGCYAIAYMVHLLHGEEPAKAKFVQDEMRRHIAESLQAKTFKLFPLRTSLARAARPDRHVL